MLMVVNTRWWDGRVTATFFYLLFVYLCFLFFYNIKGLFVWINNSKENTARVGRDEKKETTEGNNCPEDHWEAPGRGCADPQGGPVSTLSAESGLLFPTGMASFACFYVWISANVHTHTHTLTPPHFWFVYLFSFFNSRCTLYLKGIVWGAPQNR